MTQPVIIITGASRGIGEATAYWLASQGARLVLVARSDAPLQAVAERAKRLGGEVLIESADVSDANACANVVELAVQTFGRLDAVVNNAGILQPVARIAEADQVQWKYNIEVNLLGVFYMCQWAIPYLRETQGRIVNVSTGAAISPIEGWSAYCASKAAALHFTRVLALEEPAITSVALRPGVVDTEMQAVIRKEGHKAMPPERHAYFKQLKESGRLAPPEEPARVIAWLALHAPASVSGEFIEYTDPRYAEPARALFGETLPQSLQ